VDTLAHLPGHDRPQSPISKGGETRRSHGFRRLEVITGVGRRRRWSEEDKARIVAESLDPATTSSAVARRYGLHASQLFGMRHCTRDQI
jgi:transposase